MLEEPRPRTPLDTQLSQPPVSNLTGILPSTLYLAARSLLSTPLAAPRGITVATISKKDVDYDIHKATRHKLISRISDPNACLAKNKEAEILHRRRFR